jgi:hypothetical protein
MGKLRGETAKVAGYWSIYASLGPERSLEKLARILGKSAGFVRALEQYSSKYSWQERVRQYDTQRAQEAHIEREQEQRKRELLLQEERNRREEERERKRQEIEDARDRMDSEHALLGRTHALRAAKVIQDLIESKRMNAAAAVQLLKYATDIERLARGAETERTAVTVQEERSPSLLQFDLSILTIEQLEQLEQIAEEVESKKDGA